MISESDHPFIHRYNKFNVNNKKDRKFQILTLLGQDEEDLLDNVVQYNVHIFGVTEKGYSIHTKVEGFHPYYYVKPPEYFRIKHMDSFRDFVIKNMGKFKDDVVNMKLVTKTGFGYYQNPSFFIKLEFKSKKAMNRSKYIFLESKEHVNEEGNESRYYIKKKITIPGVNNVIAFNYEPFECNIDPILRFIHNTNIKACGWVEINRKKYTTFNYKFSEATTQISLTTDIENIKPIDCNLMAPFTILSFDLECTSIDGGFPQAKREGDKIIQCGFTMHIVGKDNSKPFKYVCTLDGCSNIEGAIVKSFKTEKELIRNIFNIIKRIDPDIVTGYNVYGFDFKYLNERAKMFEIDYEMDGMSRLKSDLNKAKVDYKKLESSAMGQNEMWILNMDGRVTIDLYKYIQRTSKESSYKLDHIAEKYIGKKKDDVSPNDIFRLQKGSDDDRAIIAKYCIQDCLLVNCLIDKLNIIPNNIGMANVCSVPFIFLFLRGQGIKGTSLVSKFCQSVDYVLPFLLKNQGYKKLDDMTEEEKEDMKKYTGAIVINANTGAYFEPVVVNDFSALYPSASISHNISPDCLITSESPDLPESEKEHIKWTEKPKDGQKKGTEFHYCYKKPEPELESWKKENWPIFANEKDEKKWVKEYNEYQASRKGRGIIPRIEIYLLNEREKSKQLCKIEKEKGNIFMSQIYDGLQLAYKITCNSLYGLLGAMTSDIKCKPAAASITCIGRQLLTFSRDQALKLYPGSEIIYGDTDSIMMKYPLKSRDPNKKYLTQEEKAPLIKEAIECGVRVQKVVSKQLPYPHCLAMEKVYFPFFLYSKKRYSAIMYENPNEIKKIDNKGVVLTRRDNAPIVKIIFGEALRILLFEHDVAKAVHYVQSECKKLLGGEYDIKDLIISVTLKQVKKMKQGQHILAERITKRDPGNAPQLNDRVLYVHVKLTEGQKRNIIVKQNTTQLSGLSRVKKYKKPKIKQSIDQGEKIESPEFIIANKIPIDYNFYFTNQLMKPLIDLFKAFFDDPESKIFKPIEKELYMKVNHQRPISDFFKN